MVVLLSLVSVTLVAMHFSHLMASKLSREKPLLARIAELDKLLFVAKNESLIVKRENDELRTKFSSMAVAAEVKAATQVLEEPPASRAPPAAQGPTNVHLAKEVEALKAERDRLAAENVSLAGEKGTLASERDGFADEVSQLRGLVAQKQQELAEAEAVVQECLEERNKQKSAMKNDAELSRAIETLRDQLNGQRESVQKYEQKMRKRESEVSVEL